MRHRRRGPPPSPSVRGRDRVAVADAAAVSAVAAREPAARAVTPPPLLPPGWILRHVEVVVQEVFYLPASETELDDGAEHATATVQ